MERITVLGIDKAPHRSVYTFPKDEKFLEFLDRFLEEFDLGYLEPEKDNMIFDIERDEDGYYNIKGANYDVDVFIGGKEIVLVIRTLADKQQMIADKIFKFVEFKE